MTINNISNVYYVLVFDLCSSSEILEDLENNHKISIWTNFWNHIDAFLSGSQQFILYKFLGDGFIILIEEKNRDIILELCKNIYNKVNADIVNLIEKEVSIVPKRTGITIGIDCGRLTKIVLNNKSDEYIGKAINIAVRLQTSLKEIEHTNKLLISKSVKNNICSRFKAGLYRETTRSLFNIVGDKKYYCYEINLQDDFWRFIKD